jgi:hypothetical protein
MVRRRLLAAIVVAGALASPLARASGDDVATAQVLFDEGRRRIAEHDYAGGCPKLFESQRLAPAPGTEFNLADCWEHVGKLASSWAAFLDVAEETHRRGEADRERVARERASALAPRLGRVVVDVPPLRRVDHLEVQRDGEIVGDALWGIAVPVDAGEHRVEARAPGRSSWSTVVAAQDGQTVSVTIPELPAALRLGDAPEPGPPLSSALPPDKHAPTSAPSAAPAAARTVSYVMIGASVLLASVGAFGIVSRQNEISNYNADASCPGMGAATQPGHCSNLMNAASTWSTVAVVGFVSAGLALAGGVTLWLVAPSPKAAATAAAWHCFASAASLGCAGTF